MIGDLRKIITDIGSSGYLTFNENKEVIVKKAWFSNTCFPEQIQDLVQRIDACVDKALIQEGVVNFDRAQIEKRLTDMGLSKSIPSIDRYCALIQLRACLGNNSDQVADDQLLDIIGKLSQSAKVEDLDRLILLYGMHINARQNPFLKEAFLKLVNFLFLARQMNGPEDSVKFIQNQTRSFLYSLIARDDNLRIREAIPNHPLLLPDEKQHLLAIIDNRSMTLSEKRQSLKELLVSFGTPISEMPYEELLENLIGSSINSNDLIDLLARNTKTSEHQKEKLTEALCETDHKTAIGRLCDEQVELLAKLRAVTDLPSNNAAAASSSSSTSFSGAVAKGSGKEIEQVKEMSCKYLLEFLAAQEEVQENLIEYIIANTKITEEEKGKIISCLSGKEINKHGIVNFLQEWDFQIKEMVFDYSQRKAGYKNNLPPYPIELLAENYRDNQNIVTQVRQICTNEGNMFPNVSCLVPSRGDGNCYYRSTMLGILYHMLSMNSEELQQIRNQLLERAKEVNQSIELTPQEENSLALFVQEVVKLQSPSDVEKFIESMRENDENLEPSGKSDMNSYNKIDIALNTFARLVSWNLINNENFETEFGLDLKRESEETQRMCLGARGPLTEYLQDIRTLGTDAQGYLVNKGCLSRHLGFEQIAVVMDRIQPINVLPHLEDMPSEKKEKLIVLRLYPGHYDLFI